MAVGAFAFLSSSLLKNESRNGIKYLKGSIFAASSNLSRLGLFSEQFDRMIVVLGVNERRGVFSFWELRRVAANILDATRIENIPAIIDAYLKSQEWLPYFDPPINWTRYFRSRIDARLLVAFTILTFVATGILVLIAVLSRTAHDPLLEITTPLFEAGLYFYGFSIFLGVVALIRLVRLWIPLIDSHDLDLADSA